MKMRQKRSQAKADRRLSEMLAYVDGCNAIARRFHEEITDGRAVIAELEAECRSLSALVTYQDGVLARLDREGEMARQAGWSAECSAARAAYAEFLKVHSLGFHSRESAFIWGWAHGKGLVDIMRAES